jgi:hypothetical protein
MLPWIIQLDRCYGTGSTGRSSAPGLKYTESNIFTTDWADLFLVKPPGNASLVEKMVAPCKMERITTNMIWLQVIETNRALLIGV